METPEAAPTFAGLRVVSFESRRAQDVSRLIRRLEGEALVAPSMREVPLEDQQEAFQFAEQLFAGQLHLLILLTGVGTRTLVQVLATRYPQDKIVEAFSKLILVVRGPKPIIALTELSGTRPSFSESGRPARTTSRIPSTAARYFFPSVIALFR